MSKKAKRQKKKGRGGFLVCLLAALGVFMAVNAASGGNALRCIADSLDIAPAMPMATPNGSRNWVQELFSGRGELKEEIVYPEVKEGFLPVCWRRITGEKVVALTIDDCNQADNLREMVSLIADAGGSATIFPIGENVPFLGEILKEAVKRGFEIENHTYSHAGLYAESDEELAEQIFLQNAEVSRALGVEYQMHFLRPRGGDNRYDQRTHAYMRQMGYYAIAYWSQIGSGSTADDLMENLQPGDIILFHTTDQDLEVMRELVPRLKQAGYSMVTLNSLFDLPENKQSRWSGERRVTPLAEYERFDQTLKKGDYLHDVLLMQKRLEELGFMSGKYNGYFGSGTQKAVRAFQASCGLTADGMCGPATWRALFGE